MNVANQTIVDKLVMVAKSALGNGLTHKCDLELLTGGLPNKSWREGMSDTVPYDQAFRLAQTSLHGTSSYDDFAAKVHHDWACVDTFVKAVELQGGTSLAAEAAVHAQIDTLKHATATLAEWHITLGCTETKNLQKFR